MPIWAITARSSWAREDGGRGPRGVRGVPQRSGPTARFSDLPATHDGEKPFTVKLGFSAEPRGLSYKTVRDSLLEVTGGTVTKALRVNDASDREWKVTVTPSQGYGITITQPARGCDETGSVCIGGTVALASGIGEDPGAKRSPRPSAVRPSTTGARASRCGSRSAWNRT